MSFSGEKEQVGSTPKGRMGNIATENCPYVTIQGFHHINERDINFDISDPKQNSNQTYHHGN